MGKTTKITAEMLRDAGAEDDEIAAFEGLFPDGMVPTVEFCRKHAVTFNWVWAANMLLSPKQRGVMRTAAAYRRGQAEAFARAWATPLTDQ